jgi:hypothetical protein
LVLDQPSQNRVVELTTVLDGKRQKVLDAHRVDPPRLVLLTVFSVTYQQPSDPRWRTAIASILLPADDQGDFGGFGGFTFGLSDLLQPSGPGVQEEVRI